MTRTMQIVLPALSAGMLSLGMCFCLAQWSRRLGLMANPRPDRWHEEPTPNTGGLGIALACAAAYFAFAKAGFGWIAACACLLCLVGFVDDRVQLPPWIKLAAQAAAAVIVISSGMVLHLTPWFGVNACVSAVWIIGITNAFNLIDNMDGLCAGVAVIAAASGAVLASLQQDHQRALLLTIIAASCLGFLRFNYKPARIFMGDCGSLFIGFCLASLALGSPRQNAVMPDALYAIPALLYPIFDTTLVSVLRRAAGKPVTVGGRDHSSHRLVSMGLTERKAVWILWCIAGACALCAPLTYDRPGRFLLASLLLIAALLAFGRFLTPRSEFTLRPRAARAFEPNQY